MLTTSEVKGEGGGMKKIQGEQKNIPYSRDSYKMTIFFFASSAITLTVQTVLNAGI